MLETITTGKQSKPPRIVLYGTHGIGKSTFGSMAPNPIFIQTEDGLDQIDCSKFPIATTFEQVMEQIGTLYTEEHDYQTVVIDSLDWLEKLIHARVCARLGKKSIEDIGYAKGYVFAMTEWDQVIEGLDALRSKGMQTILIAHAKVETFDNPETESYKRYSVNLHKHAAARISEWCDCLLFANYKVFVKKSDEGFNKERKMGIGTGERVIYTQERPACVAKSRYPLPAELPFDYRIFAACVRGENPLSTKENEDV